MATATNLRVGAAAARSIARRLEQQALVLSSSVAQRALSATMSLEAYARTPEGRSFVAKATELRVAARVAKRKAKETTATGTTPAVAATEVAVAETPVVTGTAPAAHGAPATATA